MLYNSLPIADSNKCLCALSGAALPLSLSTATTTMMMLLLLLWELSTRLLANTLGKRG